MSNKKITIAIDGYSSSGKSTVAKIVAQRLGYRFIDTGAMYRAITLYALKEGLISDLSKLTQRLESVDLGFEYNPALQRSEIYLNSQCVDSQIRSMEVNENVSSVAQIAAVREKLVALQQKIGRDGGVVMDGRDIGTVVFPDAELKIFMTASVEVRAKRRYDELIASGAVDVSYQEIAENIAARDWADENRDHSPLRCADDAIRVDNSSMSIEEQVEWVFERISQLGL